MLRALVYQGFSRVVEMTYRITGDIGMDSSDISLFSNGKKKEKALYISQSPPF